MSLTKLFNFKYLLQNIKKSKGLIILLVLLVPMFTSIMLLTLGDSGVLNFAEVSIINIIGMYFIPIILSITLFNYVYKKSSVDFMGSMPLSRKDIFLTNTIGGIGIIIILQLLTLICTLFLSQVLSTSIIFGSMVWDIFVYFTIAYIFVFTVSNLAMSFSGNRFSQLVAIALIIFLVPFIMISSQMSSENYNYTEDKYITYDSNGKRVQEITIEQPYNFTAPSYIFDIAVNGVDYEYNTASIAKMSVLSIIYIILGIVLFEKKKLEMAGESYETVNTHLLVKMLTFTPFMAVFCSLSSDDKWTISLFFIAILAVYYFVFDLITNKKVKVTTSIVAFIASAVVMFAIYEGIIPKFDANNEKKIALNDVKSVYIDGIRRGDRTQKLGLLIEDDTLIKSMLNGEYRTVSKRVADDYGELTIAVDEMKQLPDGYEENYITYYNCYANIVIKLDNGKTYECKRFITSDAFELIMAKSEKELTIKNYDNTVPVIIDTKLTKEQQKEIIEIANSEVTNLSLKELCNIYLGETTESSFYLYEYKNHKLIKNDFSCKGFKKLHQKIAEIQNQYTLDVIEDINYFNIYNDDKLIKYIKQNNINPIVSETTNIANTDTTYQYVEPQVAEVTQEIKEIDAEISDMKKYDYYWLYDAINNDIQKIKEFIKADSQNKFDINKEYIVLSSYYPNKVMYYTNDLAGISKLVIEASKEEMINIEGAMDLYK